MSDREALTRDLARVLHEAAGGRPSDETYGEHEHQAELAMQWFEGRLREAFTAFLAR